MPRMRRPLVAEPVDWQSHTMEDSLARYLRIKVHHLIQNYDWQRIDVIGCHDRSCEPSQGEKSDKMFNWQRPTAEPNGRNLVLKCFPGKDYVYHYALIVSTYLAMHGRYRGHVVYEMPSDDQCARSVNLLFPEQLTSTAVVLGWGLPSIFGERDWVDSGLYAWKRPAGFSMDLICLGIRPSIWGDIAGHLTSALAASGVRKVVYLGKVGALDPGLIPNYWLATGSSSIVDGELVRWRDGLRLISADGTGIARGVHVTSRSVLLENKTWLERNKTYAFVDPEIGRMGKAAAKADISYGYLHIVSNNLAVQHRHNLSNERRSDILERRKELLRKMGSLLCSSALNWAEDSC